jgi:hypothetical protein
MASKTVTIKPEFLHTSKRKTKRKLPEKVVIQPNNLREILLNKLIERRKTQKVKIDPPILNEVSFDRTPEPVTASIIACTDVATNVPDKMASLDVGSGPTQDKPYGILKNGNKPTFKTWNASVQNTTLTPSVSPSITPIITQVCLPEPIEPMNEVIVDKPELNTEKVVLGKNKKKNYISVLIENNKTRKLQVERVQKIKKTSIQTVRNYLKNHNLIKSGSAAPNPLLRTLYENVLFCGDITNQNKENLIHNFTEKVV